MAGPTMDTRDLPAGDLQSRRSNLSADKQRLLAQRLKGRGAPSQAAAAAGIPRRAGTGPQPLSFAQQRLWFLDQLMPGNPYYNVPSASYIEGSLRIDDLERSIDEIVRRHESLRTTFATADGGEPVQVVQPWAPQPLVVVDLSAIAPAELDAQVAGLVRAEALAPFDLSAGVLRVKLLRLRTDLHLFLLTMHHVVTDGWSNGIFMRELMELYLCYSMGLPSSLPELAIQYGDYTQWQRERLQGGLEQVQIGYWKEQLRDAPLLLQLPTDRPRPATQSFRGAARKVRLDAELTQRLQALSAQAGGTLFMTLLAGFGALLHRYSGQADIVIGTPTANRTHTSIEPLIGFFVNTLALRLQVRGDASFRDLLAHVRDVTLQAYDHQDVPFERLIDELGLDRDMSRNPLIQATFALQNAPSAGARVPHLAVHDYPSSIDVVRFDMEFHLFEEGGGLSGFVVYSTDLFEDATIARMIGHYENLLRAAAAADGQALSRLPLLTAAERQQLVHDWNRTDADYPRDRCAHELFEAQARRTPAAIAVECDGETLSYAELDRRANQLAHALRGRGLAFEVGSEGLVGICLERSIPLIVGMLAVWKAGGAYVPLDPALPPQRLAFMVRDARAALVLTRTGLLPLLAEGGAPMLCVDADQALLEGEPGDVPHIEADPRRLAYVIYTSGSTGLPKGVAIEHRGLVNYLSWAVDAYRVAQGHGAPVHTSIGFDATITSLYTPLLVGQRIVMVADGDEIDGLVRCLNAGHRYSLIKITPAHLDLLNHAPALRNPQPQTFVIGGEALPGSTLAAWRSRSPASRFINEYGPTETVVGCCVHDVPADAPLLGSVPIGRPIANTRLYILDRHGEPVPIGIPGELHIGGDGVARGYLHRPELTLERFVPDTLSGRTGERLYKTGDLARYLVDGTLEFLGRDDHQVKIRGYRIELGEIEAALVQHPDVLEAVTVAREGRAGDKRLVGYVVARDVSRPSSTATASESPEAAQDEMVRQWQQVFQDSYGKSADADPAGDNFAGWNSSYTGQPIPDAEMTEWADCTVARILQGRPQRLLEIGCGTGLLLGRLAAQCDYCLGTDFSEEALRHTRQMLAALPAGRHADVEQRPAHDFRAMRDRSFDTVVLNSVVQYFPTLDYLAGVIGGAVDVLQDGGRIFIGDIRSLPLLEAYHASVQAYRAEPSTRRDELVRRVRLRADAEEELLIDSRFFLALRQRFPRIAHVQALVTRGRYCNELSKFRYDAVLHVARPVDALAQPHGHDWHDWQREPLSLADIRSRLASEPGPVLAIRGISNARIQPDLDLLAWLADADDAAPLETRAAAERPALDPEALWALGEALGCMTEISCLHSKPGQFHAVFVPQAAPDALLCFDDAETDATDGAWSNNPLQTAFKRKLASELRPYLKTRLPAFMVPSAFAVLDALPLTHNGKIDRDNLPPADPPAGVVEGGYVAPHTKSEQTIAELWAGILGVERVGAEDNFFDLGGHSLLTTQVIARVREKLGVNLPLSTLFEQPTVRGLAGLIDAALRDGVTDVPARTAPVDLAAEVTLDPGIRPAPWPGPYPDPAGVRAIFLTGASGFLGAYLLHDLLRQSDATLHCLVRSATPAEGLDRLRDNLAVYGLWDPTLATRIVPVPGDLEAPLLGLTPARFDELADRIDVIYHNGAWVNFTYPYRKLKASNVSGTQEVIRLAARTRTKPLHFISTVSVFPATRDASAEVRESDMPTDWRSLASGYAQSKWVAERIVGLAAERGLPVSIYRPGTITGDSRAGACHTGDLAFRMLKGCLQMGMAPDTDIMVGLVPVDYVSRAIVRISQQAACLSRAFHLVNPRYVPMRELIGTIASLGRAIEIVPYLRWREELLQQVQQSPDHVLLPFLQMFGTETSDDREPRFDCRSTLEALAGSGIACPEIDAGLMRTYFGFFERSGFLPAQASVTSAVSATA